MSDEPVSKRQMRKGARAKAHELRSDVSWMTPTKVDPMDKLRELDQEARGKRVYGEADECAACTAARVESGDETTLCATHLAEAMGF